MTENVRNEISMKQYLLGELTESEQQELEEQLMTSNECFGELLIAEDKLVDEYLGKRLSAREKEKFNDYFLCTADRNHKLRFARSLHRYVLANTERTRTVWGWPGFLTLQGLPQRIVEYSLAAALSLIVLGGSWLTFRIQHLEQLLEQVRSQPTLPAGQQDLQQQLAQLRERNDKLAGELRLHKEQRTELEQQLAALRASPLQHSSSSSMVAFALAPGRVTRDMGEMKRVTIPRGANWVQLQLDLGAGDYKRYQAVLQKEGEEISTQITPRIKTGDDTEAVVFTLPAKLLPHGDYILRLSGIPVSGDPEDIGSYSFRVLQK
jgi:cell division protein FtsB